MSTFINDLVNVARREWTRWGGPCEAVDGTLAGFTSSRMEVKDPFWKWVGEYWESVGSNLDGRDDPPWSAAFISYCFKQANAGNRFPYNDNHSIYVSEIESGAFHGLSLKDPRNTPVAVGDLVWASRSGQTCRTPPANFTKAKAEVRRIKAGTAPGFCSHSDIVVAVRPGEVDVIGGNVRQAATRVTYRLDTNGCISDGRRNFVGVIRNGL